MFVHQQGKDLSLLDICGDLHIQHGVKVRKQSIQERFNEYAVSFMKAVLGKFLESQLNVTDNPEVLSFFNRVRVKDSTRFALPATYSETYTGTGGALINNESMISIQYEYDLLSGTTMDLRLTSGTRNDQLDSKENTHDIAENDLFIRDLGYSTLGYLKQIINGKAYFLNRLGSQLAVYHAENENQVVDMIKCRKKIAKYNLPYLQYDVIVGKDAQIPCRLIIQRVDQSTYERRLRKTGKQAKGYGHKVSDAFKSKAHLNLYITNVPEEKLPAAIIKKTYGLRWQIELFFKIWKSQGGIDQVKGMKLHRFECQLLAKLIWLIIHWKIFQYVVRTVSQQEPGETCSMWKYFKHAYRINSTIRGVINKPQKMLAILAELAKIALQQFNLEEKNGKTSHFEAFRVLA